MTSSVMELPPCCVPGESVVPTQPCWALGWIRALARSFAGARPLGAAWDWGPHSLSLLCREERTSGGPCKDSTALWHRVVKPDCAGVTVIWTFTHLSFVMPRASQTHSPLHQCHQKIYLVFHGHECIGIQGQGRRFLQ